MFIPVVDLDTTCHEILEYLVSRGFIPRDYRAHYALFLPRGDRLSAEESMDGLRAGSLSHFHLRLILSGGKGTSVSK